MTAPELTKCLHCHGRRVVPRPPGLHYVDPCPVCCCCICGQTTDTPPVCARCDADEEAFWKRRSDV